MSNRISKITRTITNIIIIFFLISFTINSIISSIFFISNLSNINNNHKLLIEFHELMSMFIVTIILFSLYKIVKFFRKNPFDMRISFYINTIGVSLLIINILEIFMENIDSKSNGLIIFNTEVTMHTILFICVSIIFFVLSNFYKKACLIKEENYFTI